MNWQKSSSGSTSRQTWLFSATMTDTVDELVKCFGQTSLIVHGSQTEYCQWTLVQKFVRVSGEGGTKDLPFWLIFLRSKKLAH
jgi:superfamily II DNA/RNA helicase